MAKAAEVAVCVVGAVAAAWLAAGSTAFIAGLQVTPPGVAPSQLRGHVEAPEQVGVGSTAAQLSVGVAVGLAAAGMAVARRGSVARKAEEKADAKIILKEMGSSSELSVYPKDYFPPGTGPWKMKPIKMPTVDQAAFNIYSTGGATTQNPGTLYGPIGMVDEAYDGPFACGLVGSEYAGWGTYEFDPLNLAIRYPEHVPWYREAELKHGRVAMLACIGLVAPDGFRIPLDVFNDGSLDMLTVHNKLIGPGLGEGPMWWLLLFCGTIESIRFKQIGLGFGELSLENAGDMGFGKGFLPKSKEAEVQMRVKELKNGRLAMLAFSGAMTQGIMWESHHFPFVPTS